MKGEFLILECGCRILALEDSKMNITLWPCDLNLEECHKETWFYPSRRDNDHNAKVRRTMTEEEVLTFARKANDLIQAGYSLDEVRNIIGKTS